MKESRRPVATIARRGDNLETSTCRGFQRVGGGMKKEKVRGYESKGGEKIGGQKLVLVARGDRSG